jgi:hypothetical protein
MTKPEIYREFELDIPYPGFWRAVHQDYDGPEDHRLFVGKSIEEVKAVVDDYWDELEPE